MPRVRERAVIETAKKVSTSAEGDVFDLPFGMKGHVVPISPRLMDDVMKHIKDPQPPMVFMEEKGREEPNYSDPTYLRSLRDTEDLRTAAGMDAMIMFGLQLDSELTTDGWLSNLRVMDKLGSVNLSAYNLDDPLELEYLYKRYVASTADVFERIGNISGINPEEVAKAEASFKSNAPRDAD